MAARLDNKVTLISGAANGMGAAHAEHFVDQGAKVILGDIDADRGQALAERLGDNALFVGLDVTDPESWEAAVKSGGEKFGPVNVLVNNAGVSGNALKTADLTLEEWTRTLEIDLNGTFHGIRAVLPVMLENGGGSIVNISSTAGVIAAPGVNAAYVAAKFAVRGITKQVAVEYGTHGVRANSVHPGAVRTELTQALLDQLGKEWEEEFFASVPLNRIAEMKEVSDAVIFLASDESSFITGSEIVVDGGLTSQ